MGAAELWIDRERPLVRGDGAVDVARPAEILRLGIGFGRVERRGRERLLVARRVGRAGVAEGAAHACRRTADGGEDVVLALRRGAPVEQHLLVADAGGIHVDHVVAAPGRDRSADRHVEAFTHRDQPRGSRVQRRAGVDLLDDPHGVAVGKRRDEWRAFDADREGLLHQPAEHRIGRLVGEVADQDGDRRVFDRAATARHPPGGAEHRGERHRHRGRRRRREALEDRLRNQLAGVVEPRQRRDEVSGLREAIVRIELQAPRDHGAERFGHGGIACGNRFGRTADARGQGVPRRRAFRRDAPAQQQVGQDQPEGVDVGAVIDRRAAGLLRRHVVERADHVPDAGRVVVRQTGSATRRRPEQAARRRCQHRLARGRHHRLSGRAADRPAGRCLPCRQPRGGYRDRRRARRRALRDPEIHDQRVVFAVDHDVGRLEIPMHDPGFVRGFEPRGDLARQRQHATHGQPPLALQRRGEILAVHERHRDVGGAVHLAEVVDANDVLVRDLTREQQLALEAALDVGQRRGVDAVTPNDLHRDRDAEHLVPGLVDHTHAAGAQFPDDAVAHPEGVAGAKARGACVGGRRRLSEAGLAGVRLVTHVCGDSTGKRRSDRRRWTPVGSLAAPVRRCSARCSRRSPPSKARFSIASAPTGRPSRPAQHPVDLAVEIPGSKPGRRQMERQPPFDDVVFGARIEDAGEVA